MRMATLGITFMLLAAGTITRAEAQDGLFSQLAMESVFEERSKSKLPVATPDAELLTRITNANALQSALESAGFASQIVGQRGDRQVTTHLRYGGWKLPLVLNVEVEHDLIVASMRLRQSPDPLPADSIVKLMSASDAATGSHFSLDPQSNALKLRSTISNRSITAMDLRARLLKMAEFAEQHSEIWRRSDHRQPIEKAEPGGGALTGTWTAKTSDGQSFAIRFGPGNRFQLVHVRQGKSRVSQGSVRRSGSRYAFAADDGSKLNGAVTQHSERQFDLVVLGKDGKPSGKLQFSRATVRPATKS